ncbi:MAG: zf-HC2 domain-containing protein [Pyrinomonadaceae bacterium]
MTCEHCQEFISAFLDNDLDETVSSDIRMHLAVCAPCAKVCEDFAMILDFCQLDEFEDSLPPNPKALWCRINNLIETEIKPETTQEKPQEQVHRNWFSRLWNNSWQFSVSQVASAILGIAVISSLLTIVGIKNYTAPRDAASVSTAPPSFFEKVLGKLGIVETPQQARERRIKEQQIAIDYWKKRVDERRAQWNAHLREAFDRNLNEINQVVFEYDKILQENPQDDISSEMLDSALSDQMELLREFSEL